MKVRGLNIDWDKVPPEVEPFISPGQTFITSGKEYSVYALSIFSKVVFILVIDDLDTPVFVPNWIFETISTCIPKKWICNLKLSDDVEMVLGPEFLAKDLGAYNSMIDQETDQLEQFWSLVKKGD